MLMIQCISHFVKAENKITTSLFRFVTSYFLFYSLAAENTSSGESTVCCTISYTTNITLQIILPTIEIGHIFFNALYVTTIHIVITMPKCVDAIYLWNEIHRMNSKNLENLNTS